MAPRVRRAYRPAQGRRVWPRLLLGAMPLAGLVLILLPQSVTDKARIWAAPLLAPARDLAQGWTLDLAERVTPDQPETPDPQSLLRARVEALENALAGASALLAEYDRHIRTLARLRDALDGLPCRLVPARLSAPEVSGGRSGARIAPGSARGVVKGAAVLAGRIDRGAREAIERGEPVLTAAGLVGVVDEVGPLTSTVRLVTDPRSSIMVQVVTRRDGVWRAGPEGVARGTDDGSAIVVQGVPRTCDVAPGDFVVTSPSPEAPLPPYLVVGRVVRCDLKPAALFYDLVVEPRASPDRSGEVYVLSSELPAAAGR